MKEEIFSLGKPVFLHIPGSSLRLRLGVFPGVGTLSIPRRRDLVLKHPDLQVAFFFPVKIQTIRRKLQTAESQGGKPLSLYPVATHSTLAASLLEMKPRGSVMGHYVLESLFGLQISTAGEEGVVYLRELRRGPHAEKQPFSDR